MRLNVINGTTYWQAVGFAIARIPDKDWEEHS